MGYSLGAALAGGTVWALVFAAFFLFVLLAFAGLAFPFDDVEGGAK